jgi:hypothetical protein
LTRKPRTNRAKRPCTDRSTNVKAIASAAWLDRLRQRRADNLVKRLRERSSGADGVRDPLDLLGVDRIDHGVRAINDPR